VTIVFDGQADIIGKKMESVVNIIFSKDETADDKIKKMIAQSAQQSNMVVVTDDRDIQYAIRALGAKVCAVKEFLGRMITSQEKVLQKNKKSKKREEKYISKTLERVITSEFEKIWLKEK